MENNKIFGKRLTKIMHNSGYTRLELAAELDVDYCDIIDYCCGFKLPEPDILTKMAEILRTTPEALTK